MYNKEVWFAHVIIMVGRSYSPRENFEKNLDPLRSLLVCFQVHVHLHYLLCCVYMLNLHYVNHAYVDNQFQGGGGGSLPPPPLQMNPWY